MTITLGLAAYGVTLPHRYLGLVVTIALGAFCFTACGAAVATFIPNEDAAPAIVNFVLFPALFISGTFGNISSTSLVGRIAAVLPVRHLVKQLTAVFDPSLPGNAISAYHLGVLFGWGVLALVVAAVRFQWEPPKR